MTPHPNHTTQIPVIERDLLEIAGLIEHANDIARRLSVLFNVIGEKTQGNFDVGCLSGIGKDMADELSHVLDAQGERHMLKYFNPPDVVH